jgi:hypothetical protein
VLSEFWVQSIGGVQISFVLEREFVSSIRYLGLRLVCSDKFLGI